MSAFESLEIVSGTPSCSLSSIAVAPSSWKVVKIQVFSRINGWKADSFSVEMKLLGCLQAEVQLKLQIQQRQSPAYSSDRAEIQAPKNSSLPSARLCIWSGFKAAKYGKDLNRISLVY